MSRLSTLSSLPALALTVLLSACGGGDGKPGSAAMPAVLVVTGTVQQAAWQDEIEALGTARANESVTLTAKVTETVTRVNFTDGDTVDAGTVLVDLSGRAQGAQLEEAQAAYKEAVQQYERQAELVKKGTIARSMLDTQIATRDATKARADAIRAALADRVITAPFAGVLGFRKVSPGALVTPGAVITTLDDIATIKLDFTVPEAFFGQIAVGQEIKTRSAAWPERAFSGVVRAVDSRVDPLTRAVTVRAELPNPDMALRPGMLLTVRLLRPERNALVVPEIAAIQIGTQSFLFRVKDDDSVEQVPVKLGARRRGEVEVLEGIGMGERIVTEGTQKVRSGAKIRTPAT